MTPRFAITLFAFLLVASPATPFWGSFFAGIGRAVGNAIGVPGTSPGLAGLMPVSVRAAQPVIDEAQKRLVQLQQLGSLASDTLDHYKGVSGTLREAGGLSRFDARPTRWLRSSAADRYGTSGPWVDAVNGAAGGNSAVAAYGRASAPVPDWTSALPTLPEPIRDGIRREFATLELADAVSVRSMAVQAEGRSLAPEIRRANTQLERAVLDPSSASQALPALLGKVSVGQVRQIRGIEQTNQLLDAMVEGQLADLKRQRDQLARSMETAAEYRAAAAAQPLPTWRMP